MKILTVISILQIGAILLLYGKLADIERSIDHPAPAQTNSPDGSTPVGSRQVISDSALSTNEARLRQIVREELAAQLDQQRRPEGPGDSVVSAGPRDPAEIERQREQVFQQLEYFTSVGRISDTEMQKLQTDIAKLDAAGRSEALKELTKALNSGRLEGRL